MNKKALFIISSLVVSLFGVGILAASKASAASPGCYKIEDSKPVKITCPTSNVVYDNGSGANISNPDSGACYVFSQNLYDKQLGYGDPYVDVDCSNLNACPSGQELRYNTNARQAPICVNIEEDSTGAYELSSEDGFNPTEEDSQKILEYLQTAINLVTAMAGLAIAAGFIIGGIQYSTSGGNPQAAAAAKKHIGNAVMALLALVFLYTFIQWLIPGGLFN